jgi:hypothetical protein
MSWPSRHAVLLGIDVALAAITLAVYQRHRRRKSAEAEKAAEAAASQPSAPETNSCCRRIASKLATRGSCTTVVQPTMCESFQLEYSVHHPSSLLRADIELVFRPDLEANYASDPRGAKAGIDKDAYLKKYLLAIPTWQPSEHDLSEIAFPVNQERRALLDNFETWCQPLRAKLATWWSDVSCPLEGTARYGMPTSAIYNELEGLTQLLRYQALPIGCCGIVLHPEWHRRAYPVTFFTLAPLEEVQAAIAAVEEERKRSGNIRSKPKPISTQDAQSSAAVTCRIDAHDC